MADTSADKRQNMANSPSMIRTERACLLSENVMMQFSLIPIFAQTYRRPVGALQRKQQFRPPVAWNRTPLKPFPYGIFNRRFNPNIYRHSDHTFRCAEMIREETRYVKQFLK